MAITWGYNLYGQLGNGNTTTQFYVVQAGTDNKWVNISAGAYHSIVIKSDRNLFCATGQNTYGQLGDNTLLDKQNFVCITNPCTLPLAPAALNVITCKGSSTTLRAVGVGNLGWYSAAIGGNYLGSGANFTTPVLSATTTYYVQDSTCTKSASRTAIVATINPLKVSAYSSADSVCAGTSVMLFGTGAKSYTWFNGIVNGIPFVPTVTKSYAVIGTDSNGCTDTTNIAVNVKSFPDSTIHISGAVITSNQAGAKYQWADCSIGKQTIAGATKQSFLPTKNGSYAVIVNMLGCIDTSACVAINNVGIQELKQSSNFNIYPNPVTNELHIETPGTFTAQLFDITGKQVMEDVLFSNTYIINTSSLVEGMYFVRILNTQKQLIIAQKVVVSKR